MAIRIGSHIPTTWQGALAPAVRANRPIDRPGIDGVGYLFGAWKCQPAQITTTTLISTGTGTIQRETLRAMIGKTISVEDPLGIVYTEVLVVSVASSISKTIDTSYDLLTTVWTLQCTATAAQAGAGG